MKANNKKNNVQSHYAYNKSMVPPVSVQVSFFPPFLKCSCYEFSETALYYNYKGDHLMDVRRVVL